MAASERVLGVGVIGLGGAFLAMIPKFVQNPNFRIAAAADIDAEIMERFRKDFPDAVSYDDAARLCASRNVDLVYIATPNRFHAEHAAMALENKKHVLIEKPMTIGSRADNRHCQAQRRVVGRQRETQLRAARGGPQSQACIDE